MAVNVPSSSSQSTENRSPTGTKSSLLLPSLDFSPLSKEKESHTSNAVNRSIDDIHTPTWMALIALSSTLRATLFHPIQLALSRKRVLQEGASPSVARLVTASCRGGVSKVKGTQKPIDFGPGGLRGMYRGYGAALCSSLLGEITYLVSLETTKKWIVQEDKMLRSERALASSNIEDEFFGHHWAYAGGAMVADTLTLFVVTPIAVVVGRQMTAGVGLAADNPYRSVGGTMKHLWHLHQPRGAFAQSSRQSSAVTSFRWWSLKWEHSPRHKFWRSAYGLRGLYQGTSAALLRVPSTGVWWGTYTAAKESLYATCSPTFTRWQEEAYAKSSRDPWVGKWLFSPADNLLLNGLASAVASVITTFLVNPVAVIQIRLQSLPTLKGSDVKKYARTASTRLPRVPQRTFSGIALEIWRREGIYGFFKGTTANIGISVFDGVVFGIIFELTKLGSDYRFLADLKEKMSNNGNTTN